jgi:hypothetical protein
VRGAIACGSAWSNTACVSLKVAGIRVPHFVRETAVPRLRSVLARKGFREIEGGIPWNFVLADERGREVDVHTVRFDEEGNGLYGPNGLMYPAGSLDGIATVRGIRVRCKTAEAQMADRAGYERRAGDHHDVRLLHERLGIPLARHYDLPAHECR